MKKSAKEWRKGELLYEGKAKQVYSISGDEEHIWLDYKDSLTAFNAQKKGAFANKGGINRDIASIIFRYLGGRKVASHWTADIGANAMICRKLQMVPLEVVVRNRVAGSFAKKFGLAEGEAIATPLVEFYFKSDKLEDPFISDDQALYLGTVKHRRELEELKTAARAINGALKEFYGRLGVDLVDFKLEFGYDSEKRLVLGDEITPDSCRLWDQKTGEKLDKDRFRRDLGGVAESYQEVLKRIRDTWAKELE